MFNKVLLLLLVPGSAYSMNTSEDRIAISQNGFNNVLTRPKKGVAYQKHDFDTENIKDSDDENGDFIGILSEKEQKRRAAAEQQRLAAAEQQRLAALDEKEKESNLKFSTDYGAFAVDESGARRGVELFEQKLAKELRELSRFVNSIFNR